MIFYILITIISILIITCGHVGLNMVKNNCEFVDPINPVLSDPKRKFWDNEDSVIKNEKILAITAGIGYGILMFMIINIIDSVAKSGNSSCKSNTYGFLLMFALFLIIVSSFLINQNKSTDSVCDKQISKNFNIIYGLLGFGIGVLLYSILSIVFTKKEDVMNALISNVGVGDNTVPINTNQKIGITCQDMVKSIIVFAFTSIILIIQCVSIVSNNNNCNTEKHVSYDKKTPNTIAYTISSLSGLFILSIIIGMIFNARRGRINICK